MIPTTAFVTAFAAVGSTPFTSTWLALTTVLWTSSAHHSGGQ